LNIGGGNGIGKALALHLSTLRVSRIVLADINLPAARLVASSLPPSVGVALHCDVSSEMSIHHLLSFVEKEHGPIDIFFANAGVLSTGGVEVTNEEWQKIWDVNTMQVVHVARHLFPLFEQRRKGFLVVTASAAGLASMPGAMPYAVTKHAAVAAAEWLAFTYRNRGVHVSCLCPQAVRTDMIGSTDGGPAGIDGILDPNDVARVTIEGVQRGDFMIMPHAQVQGYMVSKVQNYNRWVKGMSRIVDEFANFIPPPSRL